MPHPRPVRPRSHDAAAQAASFNDLLDAEQDRFKARERRHARRVAFYAVLGAILVVGIGVWGFGVETNTRNAPIRWEKLAPSISVVIRPH
ncbi:hypothetical protein [Lichenicoccus sp.]|uniref:hypothetical protein n=1 Tax=Lichenicoccus sp. TaxID=2781899 RepID=UPI003D133BFD